MKLACDLLMELRHKKIAINRFLNIAGISNRSFYGWIEGDNTPTQQQIIRMGIALELVKEMF